ncbi:MAG: ZIP family metal transporter [Oscillospiraceae bacterium]|nr:ZIP family metal transporter [Oscillospiraceae bacterium]
MQYAGLGFIFLMTCLGSATVFFLGRKGGAEKIFMGFAAGVMIAAAVWSMLIPAVEVSTEQGKIGWLIAALGLLFGALFLYVMDKGVTRLSSQKRGNSWLLFTAITLHNVPEGLVVGLSFAMAAENPALMPSAIAIATGIGIQNFPEGASVSLPLRQAGYNPWKAFGAGCISGAVEPIFGLFVYLAAGFFAQLMPWLLAISAGAMLYVVINELIPRVQGGRYSLGTFSVLVGFVMMMALDLAF